VTATGKAKRAGIELRAPSEGWNLSAHSALEVHVQNLSTQAVPVRVRVDDSSPFRLDGGSVTTVEVPADGEGFARVPLNDRLFRVAPPRTNLVGLAAPRSPALRIDPSRISRVLVHAEGADESVSFEVTGIQAVGNVSHVAAESFLPFIDQFGQFVHAEWPGRLGSAREFAARIKAEETDLRRHPTPRGRDRWGGSIGRPPLPETTGLDHPRPGTSMRHATFCVVSHSVGTLLLMVSCAKPLPPGPRNWGHSFPPPANATPKHPAARNPTQILRSALFLIFACQSTESPTLRCQSIEDHSSDCGANALD